MRRVARYIFNAMTIPPLLVCVVLCVLWVRSYLWEDHFGWDIQGGHCQISSDRGEIDFYQIRALPGIFSTGYRSWKRPTGQPPTPRAGDTFLGFRAYAAPAHTPAIRIFGVPYWFASSATGMLVIGLHFGRVLRRRPLVGLCHACGYDLRATPDRCPECGMIPAARI